jgi:phosphatidylinositol alpha-1,6-mannosyltransferase
MRNRPKTCCFVVDARLEHYRGVYWDPRQSFPEGHWQESLRVFGDVTVLARVRSAAAPPPSQVSFPPRVLVGAFPYYVGPGAALGQLGALVRTARHWAKRDRLFILRGPGFLSILLWPWLRHYGKPYAVEVLGNADEALRFVQHPLRRVWRTFFVAMTRLIIGQAAAVMYVSRSLARAYPARWDAVAAVVSDVRLTDEIFLRPRTYQRAPKPVKIIHVGNMEQPYKGHETLLRALAICQRQGPPIAATLVGAGRLRPDFERLAQELGVRDLITFQGTVPWGEALFKMLDRADLFIMCSLAEGLGKALLEAMARGLPAIGTSVGGIPELLPPEALAPPANAPQLAAKIQTLAADPRELTRLSAHNFATAMGYHHLVLSQQRTEFYRQVKERLHG